MAVGSAETVTATGTNVGGDNNPPVTLPIADPVSHAWTPSDPAVASVDAVRGVVTAHRPGVVTISVAGGGIAASAQVSVHS